MKGCVLMKVKLRKEKHISSRILPSGKLNLLIQIQRNGKMIRKTIDASEYTTPAQAMDAACIIRDEILNDIRNGLYSDKRILTVKELYVLSHEIFPCAYKTKLKHDHYFNTSISLYSDKPITDISVLDIQNNVNQYSKNHSQTEIERLLSVWKRLYKTAQVKEIDVFDKTINIVVPRSKKITKTREVIISDEDFNKFLETLLTYNTWTDRGAYHSLSIYYMLMIMYYTGLRNAEVFALTRDDIDFKNGCIHVRKAVGSNENETGVVIPTKTNESIRSVPIASNLEPILKDLLNWTNHEYLISDFRGGLYETDFVSNYIHNVAKKAKIKFNAYMLRHKFSTDLIKSHVDLRTIQELMGHTNGEMTLGYARSSNEDKKKAILERTKLK